MSFNNKIILNKNRISFLLCEKELVNYYKKFWWKKIEKKIFLIIDKKSNLNRMLFNYKNINYKRKHSFFLHKSFF